MEYLQVAGGVGASRILVPDDAEARELSLHRFPVWVRGWPALRVHMRLDRGSSDDSSASLEELRHLEPFSRINVD